MMEIRKIHEDEKITVKAVWYAGKFMYTVTYYKDAEGFVEKMVRVYANGTIEEQ